MESKVLDKIQNPKLRETIGTLDPAYQEFFVEQLTEELALSLTNNERFWDAVEKRSNEVVTSVDPDYEDSVVPTKDGAVFTQAELVKIFAIFAALLLAAFTVVDMVKPKIPSSSIPVVTTEVK